jgi:hypothetical protein
MPPRPDGNPLIAQLDRLPEHFRMVFRQENHRGLDAGMEGSSAINAVTPHGKASHKPPATTRS